MSSKETIEACKKYVVGRPSVYRQMLWNDMGEAMPTGEDGRRQRGCFPRDYWCPCVRIGNKRHDVIGPNEDGSSGAPVGYVKRADALANAQRFLAKCRAILAENGEI